MHFLLRQIPTQLARAGQHITAAAGVFSLTQNLLPWNFYLCWTWMQPAKHRSGIGYYVIELPPEFARICGNTVEHCERFPSERR